MRPGLLLHSVERGTVELAAVVDWRTVRQVTAVSEVKPEDGVARLEAREHDCRIRRGARVRLHVGPRGAEKFAQAVDRELLHLVHKLTSAVVALAGKALGVLVGQNASLCGHDGFTGVVLRGDELGAFDLTDAFAVNEGGHFRVVLKGIGSRNGGGGGGRGVHLAPKINRAFELCTPCEQKAHIFVHECKACFFRRPFVPCPHAIQLAQNLHFGHPARGAAQNQTSAQYALDYGFAIGTANYLGDIGGDNLTRQDFAADLHLNATKVSSQVFVRYRVTPFYAVKAQLGTVFLEDDDALSQQSLGRTGTRLPKFRQ